MSRTAIAVLCVTLLSDTGLAADQSWKKRWLVSVAAVAGATLLDAHSSMGKPEANPLLRNSAGQFAAGRAVAMKAAITGGMLSIQALLARRDPSVYKATTLANFGAAAAFSGAAIHNTRYH